MHSRQGREPTKLTVGAEELEELGVVLPGVGVEHHGEDVQGLLHAPRLVASLVLADAQVLQAQVVVVHGHQPRPPRAHHPAVLRRAHAPDHRVPHLQ